MLSFCKSVNLFCAHVIYSSLKTRRSIHFSIPRRHRKFCANLFLHATSSTYYYITNPSGKPHNSHSLNIRLTYGRRSLQCVLYDSTTRFSTRTQCHPPDMLCHLCVVHVNVEWMGTGVDYFVSDVGSPTSSGRFVLAHLLLHSDHCPNPQTYPSHPIHPFTPSNPCGTGRLLTRLIPITRLRHRPAHHLLSHIPPPSNLTYIPRQPPSLSITHPSLPTRSTNRMWGWRGRWGVGVAVSDGSVAGG